MSQATSIAINDGQATPVATTFVPQSVTPALSIFVDRASGIAVGFRSLMLRYKSNKTVTRASLAVAVPVLQTVNGVSVVARTLRANVELILPDGCTDAERKDLYAFVQNGLSNALVRGSLRDYDPAY